MKTLQEEAREYGKNNSQIIAHGLYSTDGDRELGFIAGANSDYVKQEIIKAKIEVLEEIQKWGRITMSRNTLEKSIGIRDYLIEIAYKISELKQQLK